MTHTQNPMGNQSERDTSCVDSLISDKSDSKALLLVKALFWRLFRVSKKIYVSMKLDKAGDERLHTDRRPIYTRVR